MSKTNREKLLLVQAKILSVNNELAYRRAAMAKQNEKITEQQARIMELEKLVKEANAFFHQNQTDRDQLEWQNEILKTELQHCKGNHGQGTRQEVGVQALAYSDVMMTSLEKIRNGFDGLDDDDEGLQVSTVNSKNIEVDPTTSKAAAGADRVATSGVVEAFSTDKIIKSTYTSPKKKQIAGKSTGGIPPSTRRHHRHSAPQKLEGLCASVGIPPSKSIKQFSWKCSGCCLRFTKVYKLKQHLEDDHRTFIEEKFGCQRCGKTFVQFKLFFRHYKAK